MDNQTLQRLQQTISHAQNIAIAVGSNPSVDEMGAALALYLTLIDSGKSANVYSPTEPIVEISNLVGIDKVKTRLENSEGADLVVSFPYKEGEIEKVSYTIENGFLNIVVKAGLDGLTFSEHDVRYTRGNEGAKSNFDVLLTVGTARLSELQSIFDMSLLKDVTVVNIDTKEDNQGYGDVVMVYPRFSSISELMTQIISDLKYQLDVDTAQNLMDGIASATENFQSTRTSYLAFEMAGILMRQGAIRPVQHTVPSQPLARQRKDFPQSSPAQVGVSQKVHGGQDRRPQVDPRQPMNEPFPDYSQPFDQPGFNKPIQSTQPDLNKIRQDLTQPLPSQSENQSTDDLHAPSDWLTPKVYKGSSNV